MKIFNVILGVFAVIASFFCMLFPGRTFLNAGWIIAVLLCAWGFCALFEVFRNRRKEGNAISTVGAVFALIGGITSLIASIIIIVRPGTSLFTDAFFLYVMIFWLIISGVMNIVTAVKVMRPNGNKMWVLTMIWGILTIIGGIYGVSHMLLMAWMTGLIVGIELLLYGIRLIASVAE